MEEILKCIFFSCHASWNSDSSESESDEDERRRPPLSKSLNRQAAKRVQERVRNRKKRITESSENSSYDSDDHKRYMNDN